MPVHLEWLWPLRQPAVAMIIRHLVLLYSSEMQFSVAHFWLLC